ncbi:IS607 family transposase [Desulfurococcus mucosus]|uniref:DNA binding domain protein, excisionase family n=1 Tax=Desulfurococcus mucosus (strain ATCC 35584 / DSM 2162 / JCM 9187 / O7/1) TaxID=765177 RepID=E8RAC7_DESM0|nr:IS607 family transposase [Desulfurococcus mucosus]ADV65433.1 DNA binding domain protein, excisionase family [Desulfurococcus mucosus DSM 2162]
MDSERLLRPSETCRILGVSYSTLRRWISEGHIKAIRTVGGKYRIPYSEVERLLGLKPEVKEVRAVIYARVSSADQRNDLERQTQYLFQYCATKGYRVVEILTDIASGLNTERRVLRRLFDLVTNRSVDVVVVAYKDRLTRFGFEYLEYFFRKFGVRIEVAFGEEPKDAMQELVEDMIAIIASFAGKLYGMRSHKKKRLIEGFRKLVEEVSHD